jgi:hypothetical protein
MTPHVGEVFSLREQVVTLETVGDQPNPLILPAGSVIRILAYPSKGDGRMADAACDGRDVLILAADLQSRAFKVEVGARG